MSQVVEADFPQSVLFEEGIEVLGYLDNYIDCQFLFGEKLHASKQYRLSEALAIANVDYDSAIHNALVDAKNTAVLFSKIQNEDRSTFSPYYMTQDEASRCIFNSFATRCFA